MSDLERAGGRIFYEVQGEGEPIVILRGLGRTVRHWLGYEKKLAEHARVIVMDLRGVGRTTVPWTWRTTIEDIAGDVAAVLDAVGLQAAHIVGVSLGGMVALATGLEHPDRCLSIATVNTSIAGQLVPRLSHHALGAFIAARGSREALQARLVDTLVGPGCPPERRREIVAQYAAIDAEDGIYAATVARQLGSAARFFIGKKLARMRPRTLIIYGTDDRFVPNLNSRKLVRKIPGATLVALEGAGHEPTLDKSTELTEVILNWATEGRGERQRSS